MKCLYPHKRIDRAMTLRFTDELWEAIDRKRRTDGVDPRTGRRPSMLDYFEGLARRDLGLHAERPYRQK
jgi:hypothetical protein